MPYIKQEQRNQLDKALEDLSIAIIKLTDDGKQIIPGPGIWNYVFSKLLAVPYGYNTSYTKINEAIGVLECAKLELYRRVAVPYEEAKRLEHGDVYK